MALVVGALVVVTKLAVSKRAHDAARDLVGEALPPREVFQGLLVLTLAGHCVEALLAGRMARRRNLPVGAWRRRTLVMGLPSLVALRRSGRPG